MTNAKQVDFLLAATMRNSGNLNSSGYAYFYSDSGRTTQKDVYDDALKSNVLTQPVSFGTRGSSQVFADGTYWISIYDKNDVLIDTIDNVYYSLLSSGGSSGSAVDVRAAYGATASDLQDALDDVVGTNALLLFTTGEFAIAADVTVPSTVQMIVEHGAYFTVASGITLTIAGDITAPFYNIFRGDGTTTITNKGDKKDIWTDATAAIGDVTIEDLEVTGTTTIDSLSFGGNLLPDADGTLSIGSTDYRMDHVTTNALRIDPGSSYATFAMYTSPQNDNLLTLRRYAPDELYSYHTLLRIATPPMVGSSKPAEATIAQVIGDGADGEIEVVDWYNNKYEVGGGGGKTYDVSQCESTELNYSGGVTKDKQQFGIRYFMNNTAAGGVQDAAKKPFILDFVHNRKDEDVAITAFADAGSSRTTVTAVGHTLQAGDYVTISGTTNYNGNHRVYSATTNTYVIETAWVADDATGLSNLYAMGAWRAIMVEPKVGGSPTDSNTIKLFGDVRCIKDTSLEDVLSVDIYTENVGIGITVPDVAAKLHVNDAVTSSRTVLQGLSDGSNFTNLELWDADASDKWGINHASDNTFKLSHYTGAAWTFPLTIDASNNITTLGNINDVTPAEFSQLKTIGTKTVTDDNWTYMTWQNQHTHTTSSPTFVTVNCTNIDFGTNTMGDGTLTGAWSGVTNLTMSGTLDLGTNTIADGSLTGTWTGITGLNSVTATELSQLETIGTTTISSGQWGYLGALDQNLTTTSNVSFNDIVVGASNDGGTNTVKIENTSNTSGSSVRLHLDVAGTSGGDPYVYWTGNSGAFCAGTDTSASGEWVLNRGTAIGALPPSLRVDPTNGEVSRKSTSGEMIMEKIVDIDEWDMDASINMTVAHGLSDHHKIRHVSVIVRNDDGANAPTYQFGMPISADFAGTITSIDDTYINLQRHTGGFFDHTDFDTATSYNRGWVYITYTE